MPETLNRSPAQARLKEANAEEARRQLFAALQARRWSISSQGVAMAEDTRMLPMWRMLHLTALVAGEVKQGGFLPSPPKTSRADTKTKQLPVSPLQDTCVEAQGERCS